VDELRAAFRALRPELDDHVFTVEVEQWVSQSERFVGERTRRRLPVDRRSGEWWHVYADAPVSVRSRHIS
jgi:hypothetical protein